MNRDLYHQILQQLYTSIYLPTLGDFMKPVTATYSGSKFKTRLAPTDPVTLADATDIITSPDVALALFKKLAETNGWNINDYASYQAFCETNHLPLYSESEYSDILAQTQVSERMQREKAIRLLQAQRRAALSPDPRRLRR